MVGNSDRIAFPSPTPNYSLKRTCGWLHWLHARLRQICDIKPDMIVRQVNETARRTPKLLHFALPIQPREGRLTVRQVRSTGLGLFLLSSWFLLVAIMSVLGHH
jgi:hypothetical protein